MSLALSFPTVRTTDRPNKKECPDCGSTMVVAEGCSKCPSCGLSFCG